MTQDLVLGMAGSGGDGIVSVGEALIAAAAHEGYHAVMTKSFGSQIRGGESSCRVRLSVRRVHNPGGDLDVAVALNWEDFLKFGAELPVGPNTIVVYEAKTGVAPADIPLPGVTPAEVLAVPIGQMARTATGTERAKNVVVLGLISGWFGIARESVLGGIRKKFAKKGPELVEMNEKAFALGESYAKENPLKTRGAMGEPESGHQPKLLTDGNDMCAAASIFAGCRFFGGYPITPSTEVMQFFTREVWKYGGSVLQAEDEIAGIGAAVGASFAGIKSMTATSGPGLSLKTEMMGLASLAELPLVIVNVQRGGPSTGMPTKPEQSDLYQAAFSAHGDVLRPVLAPTSVADTFDVTVESCNIAERYQTPVLLLSDQEIAQRKETVDVIDTSLFTIEERRVPVGAELEDYHRFRIDESGISPLSHPGLPGGAYLAAGIEHDEHGDPTANGEVHERMNAKRFRKFEPLLERRDLFRTYGDPAASLALVSWGSSAGICREAIERATAAGIHAKLLVPLLVYPVAVEVYRDFFASVWSGLVVEQSYQGQLYRILRMQLDLPPGVASFARSGANPFRPEEIAAQLEQMAARQNAADLEQPR